MKRLLTGLKPTGELTLGNYIGAISPLVKLQEDKENEILVARRLIEGNANLDISSIAAISGLSEEDIELLIDDINKEKNQ